MSKTKRRVVGFFGGAAAAVVLLAVTAYACTNLASLNLSSATGRPGDALTITGSSFNTICVCGPQVPPTPVKIRWNGIKGEVLAEMMPDKAGTISASFTVPDVKPGYYVIVATQHDETYHIDAAGTPARATFEVLTATGQSVVGASEVATASPSTDESTSTGLIALTVALGVLGLGFFAGGSLVVLRQVTGRRSQVPATVKHD
jgi:hypothetical protein